MGAASVQNAHNRITSGSFIPVTLTNAAALGDTLIATIAISASVASESTFVTSIVDSRNNRWIRAANVPVQSGGSRASEIWYARGVVAGSTTASVTLNAAAISADVNLSEWSGLWNIDPLDAWSANVRTAASMSSQILQPRQNGDLFIAVTSSDGGGASVTPASPYIQLPMVDNGAAAAYTISSGSVSSSATWNMSSNLGATCAACFVAAGGPYSPGNISQNPQLQFPETLVEISTMPDFLGPLKSNGVWTNVSSYVKGMTLGPLGRAHMLDRVQSTQGTFTLNNRDGTFNPWNTSSFLYNGGAGLKPMNPVKVTTAWNGVTSPEHYGYIQSVTPNITDVLNVDATIETQDLLQMLALKYLSNNNYAQLVASDGGANLAAYYRLGDMIGSYAVRDSSTNANTGSLIAGAGGDPNYGAIGPFLYDSSTALDLTNGTNVANAGFSTIDNSTEPPTIHNPLGGASGWSLESWFKWTSSTSPAPSVAAQGTAASIAAIPNGVLYHFTASVGTTIEIQLGYASLPKASGFTFTSFGVVATNGNVTQDWAWTNFGSNPFDGTWHHLVIIPSLAGNQYVSYLDGVLGFAATSTNAGTPLASASISALTVGTAPQGVTPFDASGGVVNATAFPGMMSDVALYNVVLTPAQILNHYNVGKWFQQQEFGASVGGVSAGRFNKVMSVIGLDPVLELKVPYAFKTLMYSETNAITTTSALNYMQTMSETEPGIIFQGPDGYLYAYNRQYQYLAQRSVTSQAVFADNVGASVTGYYDGPSLQIAADDLDLWTDIQVGSGRSGSLSQGLASALNLTASGAQMQEWSGIQSPTLASSASVYGNRTMQGLTSLQMEYDSDALAIAQNYAAWYGIPRQRVTSITLNSQGGGGRNIPQMLTLGLLDRISVGYAGANPNSPFAQDSLVESITHTVDMSQPTWTTQLALSPYEILLTPFIFGNNAQSQLGGAASVTGSGTAWIHHPSPTNYLSGTVVWTVANGSTTTTAFNASAATVQAALAALVPTTTVTGGPTQSGNLVITFGSSQATFSAVFNPAISLTL